MSSKRAGRGYFCRFVSCTVGSSLRPHNPEVVGSNPAPATKNFTPELIKRFRRFLLSAAENGRACRYPCMYPYMKALALRRLALCSLKRRAEAKGVRGCSRQPPPIGAGRRFVRGSVSAPDAAQWRCNAWEWDRWEAEENRGCRSSAKGEARCRASQDAARRIPPYLGYGLPRS